MKTGKDNPHRSLIDLIEGFRATQAVSVAARLRLADQMASGPRKSDDLAKAVGAQPDALYRLLRTLAALGVFAEGPDRSFGLTPLGEQLRRDAPGSLHGWAVFVTEESHWAAWGNLLHSVKTGENAFSHVHGMDPWSYRAKHPEATRIFDEAMSSLSSGRAAGAVSAYDFGHFKVIVDVGGGHGRLLSAILARYPETRGVLFDQPHVVSGAPAVLEAAGVMDRCQVSSGSFFEAVPPGGDAYLLSAIIHDWEDADCVRILANCHAAMHPGALLIIIERQLGPPNTTARAKTSDLNMLVGPGGRERSDEEYRALLGRAGFRLREIIPTESDTSLFEAVPAAVP